MIFAFPIFFRKDFCLGEYPPKCTSKNEGST